MAEQLGFEHWDRIVEEFDRFGAPDVSVGTERVSLRFDAAHITVFRDGGFDAEMTLHDIGGETAESIAVDHETDSITLAGESFSYTFRRP